MAGNAALSETIGIWRHNFFGLLFYPEDRGHNFIRNLDERPPDYKAAHPRHRCEKLEF
jgi:hypothetical protein